MAANRIPAEEALTDEELAFRAELDSGAFGVLYERYADSLFRYCNRRLNDDDLAAEAVSNVFERAWAGLVRFRGDGPTSFRAWLYTIANRIVIDTYRRPPVTPLNDAGPIAESNIAYLPGPSAERHARRDALRRVLAELPEDQRQIVELRLVGLNGIEIAAALGRTHSAIKSSQFRAYARLRQLMTGWVGDFDD